jgi:N-methylhydantoinase A
VSGNGAAPAFTAGSDVGGTFTDLWVFASDGRTKVVKVPTTADVISGVVEALALAAEELGLPLEEFCSRIDRLGHGTTIGLNALLTGRGARTAVVTTRGFRDTLEIGRVRRQAAGLSEGELTDYYNRGRFGPLVPRCDVVEVDERVDQTGEVVRPLDEEDARQVLAQLARDGVEAVAICTLWSTQNPAHENRLRELVREVLPGVPVSVSHEVSHTLGEYGRMSTTAANASLCRLAGEYVTSLDQRLRSLGMRTPALFMTGAGGVVLGDYLSERPVAGLFSGPAAGVIACRSLAERMGKDNVLTIDVGGTSFDVGLVTSGRTLMTSEFRVAGAEIRMPTVDVRSIGAGGGSIARVRNGELRVGPASAGADPGPACYGRGGTEPTATDADLVLGVLDPERFLGGRMRLDAEAAERAIYDHVAVPLGLDIAEAAWGIREVLCSRMADLLRQVTIERGHDPRDFTMFAGGGSGPTHAIQLASELRVGEIVVPATATAQSAFGTGTCDVRVSAERTISLVLRVGREPNEAQLAALREAVDDVSVKALAALAQQTPASGSRLELSLAVRYRGQLHPVEVPFVGDGVDVAAVSACLQRFELEYEALFGKGAAFPEAGFEIVSVRADGIGLLPALAGEALGAPFRVVGSRPVVFDDPARPLDTAVYEGEFPSPGESIAGPALVEYPGHTVVVRPGWTATSDRLGNLILRRQE